MFDLKKMFRKQGGSHMVDFKKLLNNDNSQEALQYLRKIVQKAVTGASTFDDVIGRGGLRLIFEKALPSQVASDLCAIIKRLELYPYASSMERRSCRSNSPADYCEKVFYIAQDMFAEWVSYDLMTSIKSNENKRWQDWQKKYRYCGFLTETMLLALKIDQGDNEVITGIKDILLSDNNNVAISHELIKGVAMSHNDELHEIMKNLLLAAKLQEGLRQSILHSADDGTTKFLVLMMKTVADNNLLRFSSAIRSIGVWMGLGYDYSEKRTVEKLLNLGIKYIEDESARTTAKNSADVIEMYAAMWAESVFSVQGLFADIEKHMTHGKKYQKMVAAYFLMQTGSSSLAIELFGETLYDRNRIELAGKCLGESDFDVLALIIQSYSLQYHRIVSNTGWNETDPLERAKKIKIDLYLYPQCLDNENVRNADFRHFSDMMERIPQKNHAVKEKPFDWVNVILTRDSVYKNMIFLALYDNNVKKIERLRELFPLASQHNKIDFISYFISIECAENQCITRENIDFLLDCLRDKNMGVRANAVNLLARFELSEPDIIIVENLLSLKTAEIRGAALDAIQASGHTLQSAKRLIADKNQHKRLAALDLLSVSKNSGTITGEDITEYISLMPTKTDAENILINTLIDNDDAVYDEENGFGLYDPSYYPDLPPVERTKKYTLKDFRNVSNKEMKAVIDSLIAIIEKHKDYEYKSYGYDGRAIDNILGSNYHLSPTVKQDGQSEIPFADYPLSEVWLDWFAKQKNLMAIVKVCYCLNLNTYNYNDRNIVSSFSPFAKKFIKKHFGFDDIKDFADTHRGRNYAQLGGNILALVLEHTVGNDVLFDIYYGVMSSLFHSVSESDWKEKCTSDEYSMYAYHERSIANLEEVMFFAHRLKAKTDEQFIKRLALFYSIGKASGQRFYILGIEDVVRAVKTGIFDKSELRRAAVEMNNVYHGVLGRFTGSLNQFDKKLAEDNPVLLQSVHDVVARVLEIELKRGDIQTLVSQLAKLIKQHEGVNNFVEILIALGNETLTRGYNWASGGYTKRDTLSSLLKASVPAAYDNAQTLRDAIGGRISEKRLLEAVMYAPAWISIAEDYLQWPGLKSAAWYFHAHTRESFSLEFETEVARFSSIEKDDFQRGAFDIRWFKESYETLGAERFSVLYDCAKYISGGANHRRAQLFADAVLGKLDVGDLEKQIKDKRNKDLLLCYSLAPLQKRDALLRYEFIHEFLKESRKFGAQRQQSEKTAANIALENLARNLGYADVLRFSWKMELQKLDGIQEYFKPHEVDGVTVFLEWGEAGSAEFIIDKGGKRLKSIPKAIKQNDYVVALTEARTSLKSQFSRARLSLEKAMENRDVFGFDEVSELLHHPVIGSMLEKIVFRSGDELGFIVNEGLKDIDGNIIDLEKNSSLSIAHCYDLFTLNKWSHYQRYAFDNGLVQPFKQIFRELYTVNEDEITERTVSRRYAGHQIQTKKTLALLKGRGWTVDYYKGLQKVYHSENIVVSMYALADWLTPSEIEAPTIETLQFANRKTGEPLVIEDINPILFSEIMRDIDLVVSVAHVGGVDPMASHSTIEMRGVIVAESVRLLKLSNVEISERFIKINGIHGEYSVHLGSAQVHMMGRGVLSILPVHSQHRGRIFLPFIDEDPKTAEITSKVLLLGEDGKIKDPSILRQIAGGTS
jgi:hypothetical protein